MGPLTANRARLRASSIMLRANSILETIVALVIILTLFGIATTLFVQVGSRSFSLKKMAAEQILQSFADKTSRQHQLFDSDEKIDSFAVRRRVSRMENYSNLWRIHYYIYDRDDSLLAQWQQYVLPE